MSFALSLQNGAWKKIVFTTTFLFILFPAYAFSASFSFSPASGSYAVGSTFTVGVYADSEGQALNAVSGTMLFPSDKLQVTSISKNQSVISLWVQEPSYSNAAGTVNFEGIVLNPGYTGRSGKVATITFRVTAQGVAGLNLSAGSILANDGAGSEILSRKGTASFTLIPRVVSDETEPNSTDTATAGENDTLSESDTAATPTVQTVGLTSGGWSNQTTQNFSFGFGAEVSAIRILLDDKPDSIPVVVYEPAITSKEITGIPEGVSYLHVQTKINGVWGPVVHHTITIDTKSPADLAVEPVTRSDGEQGAYVFMLKASDAHSGIERFEVILDGRAAEVFTGASTVAYIAPLLAPGSHTLVVRGFDAAGNSTETTYTFTVAVPSQANVDTSPLSQFNFVSSGTVLVTLLSIVIPTLALILLLGLLLLYMYRHYRAYKKHVYVEVAEAKAVTKQVFTLITTDLEADIALLEKAKKKRLLTKEESKLLKHLKQNIAGAEKVITEEVDDIVA